MFICDVRKPGFYTDIIVERLEDLHVIDIIFLKEAGYTTEPLPRAECRLRRGRSSDFRRSPGMLSLDNEREETDKNITGISNRESSRTFWISSNSINPGFWNVVREQGNEGGKNIMESRGRGLSGDSVRDRVVKLDIDVPIEYYDPEQLLQDKLKMLHALGYFESNAFWTLSPSKHHIHIIIELNEPVPLDELFYIQFALGDDPKRATFNFLRLKHYPENAKYFNVLFDRKLKVTKWTKIKILLKKVF